jgi:hypothetical protein
LDTIFCGPDNGVEEVMVSTAAHRRIWLSRRRRKGAMDGSSKEQPRLGGGGFGLLE